MARITSKQAQEMMDAYARVYETKEAPGELDNNDDEHDKLEHGSQYDNVTEDTLPPVIGLEDEEEDEESDEKNEAIKKAMKETADNYMKKPTKRLSDLGNVGTAKIPALGDLIPKKK